MAEWRIELFGGFAILKDGVPTAQEVSARNAAKDLLALLVLDKGRGIDGDTLAARLWPESTPWQATDNLYTATSRLRAALGDASKDILIRQGRLYRIDDTKVTTDVSDFDRLARKVTFADSIDHEVKAALDEIEELYKGDLLGRGELSRNRILLAYNEEYKTRVIGVWEIAAGLYLERGDDASRIKAGWYAGNIGRLQGLEDADVRAARHRNMLGESSSRPSIRSQLAASRQQVAQRQAVAPKRVARSSHGLER
jgi:DNA-binding SARP family transcriptional activator